jgi:hypothetical protein
MPANLPFSTHRRSSPNPESTDRQPGHWAPKTASLIVTTCPRRGIDLRGYCDLAQQSSMGAIDAARSRGAITNRAARWAQPAKAPRVGEQLQPRPLLWLVRTHCGLGRICGSRRILNRRDHGRDDLRKPRAGLLGFEAMTCGSIIPDSPSTRREFSDNSRRHEEKRKPVSSANVHAKTPGGPRRARTDDLRIKRSLSGSLVVVDGRVKRWYCSRCVVEGNGG